MFLKICLSPKCCNSGKQVILVGYFRTMGDCWAYYSLHLLEVTIWKLSWDRQENYSDLLPASYVFNLGFWFVPKSLPCICISVLTAVEGVCTWLDLSMDSTFSLINFGFNIFRKWFTIDLKKISCLHSKFKLKLVCKILKMLFVHMYWHS